MIWIKPVLNSIFISGIVHNLPFEEAKPWGFSALVLVALTNYAFEKNFLKLGSDSENVQLLFIWRLRAVKYLRKSRFYLLRRSSCPLTFLGSCDPLLLSPVEEFAASLRADLRPHLLQEHPVVVVCVLFQLVEFPEQIWRWGHIIYNEAYKLEFLRQLQFL